MTLTLYHLTLTLQSGKITINRLGMPKTIWIDVNLEQITQFLTDIYPYKDLAHVYGGHFEFYWFLRGSRQKKSGTVTFYLYGSLKVALVLGSGSRKHLPLPIPLDKGYMCLR